MSPVLDQKRLRITSYCHLPPITIRTPHIPPDPEQFPATSGFEDYSVAPVIGWFGGRFELVDVSGLTCSEVEKRVRTDFRSGVRVEAVRFLQCLDWIHRDAHHEKFVFERIVAYPVGGEPAVAVHTEAGFERAPYPGDETPWEQGTLCLLSLSEL